MVGRLIPTTCGRLLQPSSPWRCGDATALWWSGLRLGVPRQRRHGEPVRRLAVVHKRPMAVLVAPSEFEPRRHTSLLFSFREPIDGLLGSTATMTGDCTMGSILLVPDSAIACSRLVARSQPATYPRRILAVLRSELAFKVAFFAQNDTPMGADNCRESRHQDPRQVKCQCQANLQQCQREIRWIPGDPECSRRNDAGCRFSCIERGAGLNEGKDCEKDQHH